MDIVGIALDFIARYGLVAIFVLLVLDGALLLPVFPGELVLIMAVAAYAHDTGDLVFLVGLTTAAGLTGSLILYSVTRGGGRRLVERFPRFFMMPRRRRERLERTFQRPLGQSLVLWLRLIPFTRILVNIPAGLARMPVLRFVVLSTIGLTAYHAAFLWFTFEANRPGSALAAQQQQLQDAYASPAWDFVQTNTVVTGAALLLLGVVLSVRASVQMYRDPEEHAGSLLGSLATLLLFWGGVALAVATYLDPRFVYAMASVGGADVPALAAALGLGPVQLLFAVAGTATVVGFLLARLRREAMRRHKRHRQAGQQRVPRTFELLVPPPWWTERVPEPQAATPSKDIRPAAHQVRFQRVDVAKDRAEPGGPVASPAIPVARTFVPDAPQEVDSDPVDEVDDATPAATGPLPDGTGSDGLEAPTKESKHATGEAPEEGTKESGP